MHTLLRIALAIVVPLIAVAILVHLRDDARERSRLMGLAAQQPPAEAAPIAPASAAVSPQKERRYEHLDDDLPPPSRVLEITERAMAAVNADQGFMPSIALASGCYDALGPTPSLEDRAYCLQVDAIAFSIGQGAPPEWQAADERSDDYFVRERFEERQRQFAPPAGDIEAGDERREGALDALGIARHRVMTAFLEHLQERAPDQ